MGRGRISMELIQKEKARKTTFQKRKNGLMKKVYEFSTLCGVDACIIIYAPNFDCQEPSQPETWPQETSEVHRIIEKYYNTTTDRHPKIYDVKEYYKDRMKKVEAEISKVCKEKLKIIYPTWDDSFNPLGKEQLRIFISMLDTKLDACNRRINILKQDEKGKAIAESNKAETVTHYLASSDPSSYLNFMSQGQLFPPHMKPIGDNNQVAFCPFWLGQSSQTSMVNVGQNCMQSMGNNGMVDWDDKVRYVSYDPKIDILKDDVIENNQNSSGNIQTMQPYRPYSIALQPLASQNPQYESAFQSLTGLQHGVQLNGLYDTNMLQVQMFNNMHGKK